MMIFRDGIEFQLDPGSKVSTRMTSDGHTIESWKSNGKRVYFANLAKSVYCAHGETLAEAVSSAIWKDPARRPSLEALVAEIRPNIKTRKITVFEFQVLTGACSAGCKEFLARNNLDMSTAMTLKEFLPIGGDWALKLASVLDG